MNLLLITYNSTNFITFNFMNFQLKKISLSFPNEWERGLRCIENILLQKSYFPQTFIIFTA
jgi:hypothetical protein